MPTPCEILVNRILPHVRALIAQELATVHGMKGRDIAPLIGTNEAAVSHYLNGIRGIRKEYFVDFPEIGPFAEKTARELFEKRDSDFELIEKLGELCTLLRKNEKYVEMFTQGRKGFSCGICYRESP